MIGWRERFLYAGSIAAMQGFVDEARVHAKGGDGGAGAVSFRREAHVNRGGPDGGDGGSGGSVWLVASRKTASLLAFKDHPHRRGADGGHGSGAKRHGPRGEDLFVQVPEGTVVASLGGGDAHSTDGYRRGEVLADLMVEGDRFLAAKGGHGGMGNARFLSNSRRAPAFAEQGEQGEERWLQLELKLMADVALIGFPNSGKSTLISRLSAARPKIADYPFTTLQPHLGVVRIGDGADEREVVLADIPGLVEGAADGRGLGQRFLRHVERARALVVLVDLAQDRMESPEEQERILTSELARYSSELADLPRIIVGSRVDLATSSSVWPESQISAVTGAGLNSFTYALSGLVQDAAQRGPQRRSTVVSRPEPEGVRVARLAGKVFVVSGRLAVRAVALSDLTDQDAVRHVQKKLRSLGVERALARAGAKAGDTVRVGPVELTFEPDGDE